MFCPKCKTPSLVEKHANTAGIKVDGCSKCMGVWFDRGELDTLLEAASKDLYVPADAQSSGRVCPKCRRAMFSFYYPQTYVAVEMCKSCRGLWLDGGEYKELKAVREGLTKRGKAEDYAPVTGLKGSLIRFIDAAIESLEAM